MGDREASPLAGVRERGLRQVVVLASSSPSFQGIRDAMTKSKGEIMLNTSLGRPLVLVLVGVMLLTFCSAPTADAAVIFLVPAVVVGVVGAAGGIGTAIRNAMKSADKKRTTRREKPLEQNNTGALGPTMAEPAPAQGQK